MVPNRFEGRLADGRSGGVGMGLRGVSAGGTLTVEPAVSAPDDQGEDDEVQGDADDRVVHGHEREKAEDEEDEFEDRAAVAPTAAAASASAVTPAAVTA